MMLPGPGVPRPDDDGAPGGGGGGARLRRVLVALLAIGALVLVGTAGFAAARPAAVTTGVAAGKVTELYGDDLSDCMDGCEEVFKPCWAGKNFFTRRPQCKYDRWICREDCRLTKTTTPAPSLLGFLGSTFIKAK